VPYPTPNQNALAAEGLESKIFRNESHTSSKRKKMNLKKLATENKPAVLRTILIFTLILLAAALRLAPHPWNFTPVGAIAIFAGATVRDRRLAFLFPLLVMFATDT